MRPLQPPSLVTIICTTICLIVLTHLAPERVVTGLRQPIFTPKAIQPATDAVATYIPPTAPSLGSAPFGPIGLRDDLLLFPFQGADGRHVTLLTTFWASGRWVWPLRDEGQVWCRGDRDAEWSMAKRRHETNDPHEHVLVLQCAATGSLLNLELRSKSGTRALTVPMQSIRRRQLGHGPHVAAWTMVSGWTPRLPLWLEYHLLHGVEEFYLYDNSEEGTASSLTANLKPYIDAGLVTVVPWYKGIVEIWTGGWIKSQILAMNHVIRSLDGYADWVLMADIDEFPAQSNATRGEVYSYASYLDEAVAEDPETGSVLMLNCFARPRPSEDYRAPLHADVGDLELLADRLKRVVECHPRHVRSKPWVRPEFVTTHSVHLVTSSTGTELMHTPDDGLYLLHLSDHPEEWSPFDVDVDLSIVADEVAEGLAQRYGLPR